MNNPSNETTPSEEEQTPSSLKGDSQWLLMAINDIKDRLSAIENSISEDAEKKTKLYTDMDWVKKLLWAGIGVLIVQLIRSFFE